MFSAVSRAAVSGIRNFVIGGKAPSFFPCSSTTTWEDKGCLGRGPGLRVLVCWYLCLGMHLYCGRSSRCLFCCLLKCSRHKEVNCFHTPVSLLSHMCMSLSYQEDLLVASTNPP